MITSRHITADPSILLVWSFRSLVFPLGVSSGTDEVHVFNCFAMKWCFFLCEERMNISPSRIRIGLLAGNQCNKLTELYPCDLVAMRRLRTCEES